MKLGKKILRRMAELGIKSNRQLADIISGERGKSVHPYTVGKWIAGQSSPRGENLIALAKALKVSADLLVLEEGQNPEQFGDDIREMIRDVVKRELKLLGKDSSTPTDDSEIVRFLSSDKIPKEDKDSVLRQIKNLLERYESEK